MERFYEALARSTVYRLLSRAFLREPTTGFLAGLAEPTALQAIAKVGGPWMAGLPKMDLEALAEELTTEYARLFVGPGYHLCPYESMHLAADSPEFEGADGQLFGKPAVAVSDFYRLADMAPAPAFRGLPDHIGVELECMSHLSAREARAWKRDDVEGAMSTLTLEQAFLRKHLVPWLPRFARRVRAFAAHPFYCALASAASRFVQVDARTVGELLGDRRAPDEETGEPEETATSLHSNRRP